MKHDSFYHLPLEIYARCLVRLWKKTQSAKTATATTKWYANKLSINYGMRAILIKSILISRSHSLNHLLTLCHARARSHTRTQRCKTVFIDKYYIPIDHETPLFSTNTCKIFVANAPFPAVNESPMAAITSISPGRTVCAEDGTMSLLAPGPFGSQKKRAFCGYGFCTFLIWVNERDKFRNA